MAHLMKEDVTIIIFGASGDLSKRKLLPALSELYKARIFSSKIHIVGFARSQLDKASFIAEIKKAAPSHDYPENFFECLSYVSGGYDHFEDFLKLKEELMDKPKNKLFYMAVPPEQVLPICKNLSESKLCSKGEKKHWERIIFEKPFATNFESARAMNEKLITFFDEDQIYRIDHYLGKETVQNIMAFRFANIIFEPLWNRQYIDYIDINVSEELGIVGRGEYFDRAGIVKDVIQNHALQLLAMLALEPPINLSPFSIRNEKVKLLRSIRPPTEREGLRAQYEGYLHERGVKKDSKTETFAALKLYMDTWRWSDVPIYIRTGKALMEKSSEISIFFKKLPHKLFQTNRNKSLEANVLVFKIQPQEGIHLYFQSKSPGLQFHIAPVDMDFSYHNEYKGRISDAYERLLLDALLGDASLFIRGDEVEASWKIVDPILKVWEEKSEIPLYTYKKGQLGPDEMFEFIARDGHEWNQNICRLKI